MRPIMEQRHIVSSQRLVSHRQVPMRGGLGTPVVHLLGDGQLLLVVLDGLLVEPRRGIRIAYVAVCSAHAGFILQDGKNIIWILRNYIPVG